MKVYELLSVGVVERYKDTSIRFVQNPSDCLRAVITGASINLAGLKEIVGFELKFL